MRTTLTLNDEVVALLNKTLKKKNISLKQAINTALKIGLLAQENEVTSKKKKKFSIKSHNAGKMLLPDITNIGEILSRFDEYDAN